MTLVHTSPVFIVNPISGTKNKTHLELPGALYTKGPGHATELAREAVAAGAPLVVAVGGDGTVNEVARALVHTNTALGIIPSGSGNALARHLNIPLDQRRAFELLSTGTIRPIDTISVNEHVCVTLTGFGFDARVSRRFSTYPKRGLTSYLRAILKELQHLHSPQTYTLEIDGEIIDQEALIVCCANVAQYGHNIYIAPQASVEDGLIDLMILHPFSPSAIALLSLELLGKQLLQSKNITFRTCKQVRLLAPSNPLLHIDGDPIELQTPISLSVQPQSLRVLAL